MIPPSDWPWYRFKNSLDNSRYKVALSNEAEHAMVSNNTTSMNPVRRNPS